MNRKRKLLTVMMSVGSAVVAMASSSCSGSSESEPEQTTPVQTEYPIAINTMHHNDPFFFADEESQMYYHVHPRYNLNGTPAALDLFESPNLTNWRQAGVAWEPSRTFLGNNDCWAPDIYKYKGKHYIFVTFSRIRDISEISHWNLENFEIKAGTTVFVSDKGPKGPYRELLPADKLNVTPSDWMCIDGSLYVDDEGNPWMIYSGELTQFYDGRVYAQRMSDDLSSLIGEPTLLFTASEAPWVRNSGVHDGKLVYITDAPYAWKDPASGNLIMIFSSNSDSGYAMGQAISKSGSILGPWEQQPERLNTDTGGHGHVFKDLDGNLRISYHTRNFGTGAYVSTVKPISIVDGKFQKIN